MKKINILSIITKIQQNLSIKRKVVLAIFFLFSLFSAFAEIASISSVIPFMELMINHNKVIFYFDKLNIDYEVENFTKNQILISITLVFVIIISFATLLKFFLGYVGTKISTLVTHDMNKLVFSQVLNADYITDNKNDENNINASILQVNSITVFLEQFLSIVSNIIILSFVLLLVISLTDEKVIYASLIFFTFYLLITFITKKTLYKNSEILAVNYNSRVAHLNNTIALFKNIKVDILEKFFFSYFKKIDYQIARSSLINAILISMPGTLMISLSIIIFSILILTTNLYGYNLIDQIPTYAALVFGTQKMIPMMQNIYGAISKMRSNSFQALTALNLISKNKKKNQIKKKYQIKLNDNIKLKNISFKYASDKNLILKNLNFEMEKGDRILISGPSGSGKTTFLNILLGLIKPLSGHVQIDGKKIDNNSHYLLRKFYSYIPQNIYVFNGAYKDNITLNFSKDKNLDKKKIIIASKIAEIHNFIMSTNNNYETTISHNGRDISGGQLQRIGIARGIYKDSNILIFDESTNSLDLKTENKIYKNLNKKEFKNKIMIFISHKKINDKYFNKKYNFVNKKLERIK